MGSGRSPDGRPVRSGTVLISELVHTAAVRAALAAHDVGAAYRLLIAGGVTQREIAAATGQEQSEVSDIRAGRRVCSVWVLERIADGLGVSRGLMGLGYGSEGAYDGVATPPAEAEEVTEDVKRRNFVSAVAGTVVWGYPFLGDQHQRTVRDVLTAPPDRIGATDVHQLEQTVARLGVLDREAGGMAAQAALSGTAQAGEQMLKSSATDPVHTQLRHAVSEAHRLAGWAAGDIGLTDHCRAHMRRAMNLAADDKERLAAVVASSADMEKHYGAPDDALKLFQIAAGGLPPSANPQSGAVLHGLSASAYLAVGHPDQARAALQQSRRLFGEASQRDDSSADQLPFFAFYGPGLGLLAATESKLADYEPARADVQRALDTRPDYDVRCRALDTIVLATILVNSGELRDGFTETRRAMELVPRVGSQRVRDRLAPLDTALARKRDSTAQDLARRVRQLAMA